MSGPDYIVEIGGKTLRGPAGGRPAGTADRRRWLSIQWRCCSVYSRIYRNQKGTAYEGYCPRCARPLRIGIGSEGTDHRFFEAH